MIAGPILIVSAVILFALAFGSEHRATVIRRTGREPASSRGHLRLHLPGLPWRWWPLVGAAAAFVVGGVVAAMLCGIAAAVVVATLRRRHGSRVASLLDEQLADAVRSIAAALRAGLSVAQAIAYAAREADPPLARSLARVVDRLDLGGGLDGALRGWAADVASDDARLVVGVLALHRRSGGDLPIVLDQVAATLRERASAAREVLALTAQARLSGAILGLLPIAFFGFLWLTSSGDVEGAFNSSIGVAAVAVGLILESVAFLWIRSLLRVA